MLFNTYPLIILGIVLMLYRYPGTGEYDKFFGEGIYKCAGCGTPLYRSTTKFNSGCGWPAFYEGLPGAINCNVSFFPFCSTCSIPVFSIILNWYMFQVDFTNEECHV